MKQTLHFPGQFELKIDPGICYSRNGHTIVLELNEIFVFEFFRPFVFQIDEVVP